MKDISDLRICRELLDFSNYIWKICIKWDFLAQKTVGIQLIRAVDSISANIAEGFGRFHYNENLHFCYYARGSLEKTKDWLRKAFVRKLIPESEKDNISEFLPLISKKLNAYINSIKAKKQSTK